MLYTKWFTRNAVRSSYNYSVVQARRKMQMQELSPSYHLGECNTDAYTGVCVVTLQHLGNLVSHSRISGCFTFLHHYLRYVNLNCTSNNVIYDQSCHRNFFIKSPLLRAERVSDAYQTVSAVQQYLRARVLQITLGPTAFSESTGFSYITHYTPFDGPNTFLTFLQSWFCTPGVIKVQLGSHFQIVHINDHILMTFGSHTFEKYLNDLSRLKICCSKRSKHSRYRDNLILKDFFMKI